MTLGNSEETIWNAEMKSIDLPNRKQAKTEIATASVCGNFIASQRQCRGNISWFYI